MPLSCLQAENWSLDGRNDFKRFFEGQPDPCLPLAWRKLPHSLLRPTFLSLQHDLHFSPLFFLSRMDLNIFFCLQKSGNQDIFSLQCCIFFYLLIRFSFANKNLLSLFHLNFPARELPQILGKLLNAFPFLIPKLGEPELVNMERED